MDNELSSNEIISFNEFIEKNPALQDELTAFESIQFYKEETPIYDGKNALLKKTGAVVLLKKFWPLMAAVLLTSVIWPFVTKNKNVQEKVVVENKAAPKTEPVPEETTDSLKEEILIMEKSATILKEEYVRNNSKPALVGTIKEKKTPTPKKIITQKKKLAPIQKEITTKAIVNINKEIEKPIAAKEKVIIKKPEHIVPSKVEKKESNAQEFKAPESVSKSVSFTQTENKKTTMP